MPERSRVLMVVQNPFFSDSRVLRIAGSIASRGADVTLLALEAPGLPRSEQVAGFKVRRVRLRSRAISGRAGIPIKVGEYFSKVLAACLRSGARIYHVHDPLPVAPAIVASWFTGAKVVYDVHELHFAMPKAGRAQNLGIRAYESVILRGVDRVIMSDGESRTALFRKAHRYDKPIEYVYNCPPEVDYPASTRDLRVPLGIAPNAPLVVFTGHVGYGRPIGRIIAGMASWPVNAHFVMLGYAPDTERRSLEAVAEEAGVRERVHFYGPVAPNEVVPWLMSATVATPLIENVGASYYNSAPTKMFEAILARVPQVASDFPEIRRVVRDNPVGPVGTLVDPADGAAITSAIVRLLSDPQLRNSARDNADRLARGYFNWGIEEAKLVRVYDGVAPGLLSANGNGG